VFGASILNIYYIIGGLSNAFYKMPLDKYPNTAIAAIGFPQNSRFDTFWI